MGCRGREGGVLSVAYPQIFFNSWIPLEFHNPCILIGHRYGEKSSSIKSLVDGSATSIVLGYIYLGLLENSGMLYCTGIGLIIDIDHRTSVLAALNPMIYGIHSTVPPGAIWSYVSTLLWKNPRRSTTWSVPILHTPPWINLLSCWIQILLDSIVLQGVDSKGHGGGKLGLNVVSTVLVDCLIP